MGDKVLLKGGCVLTLSPKLPNFPAADVLIEEGRIAEVGPNLKGRDTEVVDVSDRIVMPGFVDCHRHVLWSLLRNLGSQDPDVAAVDTTYPEDRYAATLVGLLGAAEAGITTVVDWAGALPDASHTEAALQAHAESGLRTVFVTSGQNGAAAVSGFGPDRARLPPMTTLAWGYEAGDEKGVIQPLAEAWAAARRSGSRIHVHSPPKGPGGEWSSAADLFGPDVTVVHGSWLDAPAMESIASRGAAVVVTPVVAMTAMMGSPPVQEMIDHGVRPGLGIEDERLGPGDMFAQMRAIISLQHATLFELKLAGKGGVPQLLSTREVIRYATVEGARVAGMEGLTGRIEPGMQADVIVLRTDRPNISPVNDPIGAVVWGMDTSNLDWVFVAGRAVMRNGAIQGDLERVRRLAVAARERVGVSGSSNPGRGNAQ